MKTIDVVKSFHRTLVTTGKVSRAEVEKLYDLIDEKYQLSRTLPLGIFTRASTATSVPQLADKLSYVLRDLENEDIKIYTVEELLAMLDVANKELPALKEALVKYRFNELPKIVFMLDKRETELGKLTVGELPKALPFLREVLMDDDVVDELATIVPVMAASAYPYKNMTLNEVTQYFKSRYLSELQRVINNISLNIHEVIEEDAKTGELYFKAQDSIMRLVAVHELQFTRFFAAMLRLAATLEKNKSKQ